MILFVKDIMSGEETQYILHDSEDFEELFHLYPKTRDIALRSKSLKDAASKIASYIAQGSRFDAWLEGDQVMKSLQKVAAVAAMAMPAATGGRVLEQAPKYDLHAEGPDTTHLSFGEAPEDSFLWTLMQIESSGGKNFAHPEVKTGPLKGEVAVGKWGLMKPTVKEILDRMKLEGKLTSDLKPLYNMDRTGLVKFFELNPAVELRLARILAHHCLVRQNGNIIKAAFSWNHGHNLKPENITDNELIDSEYIKKFKSYNQVNPFKKMLKKAEEEGAAVNETPDDFKLRLVAWSNLRNAQAREHMPHTSSFRPDPGRLRDPKLDEKPTKGVLGKLVDSIKSAAKGHKKS